jgi:hypothetical protein
MHIKEKLAIIGLLLGGAGLSVFGFLVMIALYAVYIGVIIGVPVAVVVVLLRTLGVVGGV